MMARACCAAPRSSDYDLWAVHAGGRTILDAVETGFELAPQALHWSRGVLRDYGNMSSATLMFVLAAHHGAGRHHRRSRRQGLCRGVRARAGGGKLSLHDRLMAVDFARRADEPERMDADDLPPETYAALIADLARVNTITMARPPTLAWLARATAGVDSFSLVDVGFGHGDMLRAIAGWARRTGKRAQLTGVDLNPRSAPVATAASAGLGIEYLTGDAATLAGRPDFIISSLVAHHMSDAELIGFIRWMEATAVRGWFINDLHRHRLAWVGFRLLAGAAALAPDRAP